MVEALVAEAEAGTKHEARKRKIDETAAGKEMHARRVAQAKRHKAEMTEWKAKARPLLDDGQGKNYGPEGRPGSILLLFCFERPPGPLLLCLELCRGLQEAVLIPTVGISTGCSVPTCPF